MAAGSARFTCLAWIIAAGFVPSWKGEGGKGGLVCSAARGWRSSPTTRTWLLPALATASTRTCLSRTPHPRARALGMEQHSHWPWQHKDGVGQPSLWVTREGMGPSGRWVPRGVQLGKRLSPGAPSPCTSLHHGQRCQSRKKQQWFSVASV